MRVQEAKVSTFFLTTVSVGPLVFAFTRVFSLWRWTHAAQAALVFGLFMLVVTILVLALDD